MWMSANGTLKCFNADQVFLLLKSSDDVLRTAEIIKEKDRKPQLILRKYYDTNESTEFRCFIKDGTLIAISQKHPNFFEFLVKHREIYKDILVDFFNTKIRHKFHHHSCIRISCLNILMLFILSGIILNY
eukprot:TRINITY_DN4384_c0_g2_i4.p1 TRINITY_DN4384_c0_g2~~TRINITY_DN4384_c0_g2_i4.p1  ORF type:complete len:130 (-),score=1.11 TRINITY_DN4384_c0_g2_i4:23-412(-)